MASYPGRGVHGQVVELLGARIVSGALAEGAIIDVRASAAELDVSLTVLRESLKVLAGKGLIGARQKRGTYVLPHADWNYLDADVIRWRVAAGKGGPLLRDLAEARSVVEPAAARYAAERRTPADLDALEAALDAMREAGGEPGPAAAADAAFHRALLAATRNELLSRMDLLLEPALRERDRIVHADPAGRAPDDPLPSHRAVFTAVRDGDPDAAEAAVRSLLDKASADLGIAGGE